MYETLASHSIMKTFTFLAAVVLILCGTQTSAADLQAKTTDGQVVQGEYLGTENNVVRIKTSYGIVSIPSKNIVSLVAVNSPDKSAPATQDANANLDALVFKEPLNVTLTSLLAARMPSIPEPDGRSRIELFRCIRNFSDSSDNSRQRIVRILGNYGLMAYPFIEGTHNAPNDLDDKVELIQAVAGPRRPYGAQIFAATHANAMSELSRTAYLPPQLPYEVATRGNYAPTREERIKTIAREIRIIEGYAAASGGPFNALFLLNIYKSRYNGDADVLLKNIATDRARLAVVATDYKSPASGWTTPDRVLVIDMSFPLYFRDNEDIQNLAQELLKKLLPDKHPAWDAPQAEWFQWWSKQRGELLKGK